MDKGSIVKLLGSHVADRTLPVSLHFQGSIFLQKDFSFLLLTSRALQDLRDGKCCCVEAMGTCSSAQKKTDSTVKASNGVSFKAKEVFISSPIKEKPLNEENSEFGSKEEKFFDSKLWLDTDGEDEFLSVNGDFTPSRCSTPNHESMRLMTPKRSTSFEIFPRPKPEPSSTGRKKLAELLRETSQGEKPSNGELQTGANGYQNSDLKVGRSSAYGSGDGRAVPCCLPSLFQTNGFNEKRKMNPLHCCA